MIPIELVLDLLDWTPARCATGVAIGLNKFLEIVTESATDGDILRKTC